MDSLSLPAVTMSNDKSSLSRHLMCKKVFYLGNNFGLLWKQIFQVASSSILMLNVLDV